MPVKKKNRANPNPSGLLPRILILGGIALIVVVLFLVKSQPSQPAVPAGESPEAQMDRYLEEKKPIFAFFHSTDCHSCMVMMETVDQVYPEFKEDVALVDVNVYDTQNENLLRRARINSIPTLVFIDRNGEGQVFIGVIEAEALRQQLTALKKIP